MNYYGDIADVRRKFVASVNCILSRSHLAADICVSRSVCLFLLTLWRASYSGLCTLWRVSHSGLCTLWRASHSGLCTLWRASHSGLCTVWRASHSGLCTVWRAAHSGLCTLWRASHSGLCTAEKLTAGGIQSIVRYSGILNGNLSILESLDFNSILSLKKTKFLINLGRSSRTVLLCISSVLCTLLNVKIFLENVI
jgi:hypothetical protein